MIRGLVSKNSDLATSHTGLRPADCRTACTAAGDIGPLRGHVTAPHARLARPAIAGGYRRWTLHSNDTGGPPPPALQRIFTVHLVLKADV